MAAASSSTLFIVSLLLVTAQYSQFLLPQLVFAGGFHHHDHFKEKNNNGKLLGISIPNPLNGESTQLFGLHLFDPPVEDHAYETDYQGLWELVSKDSGANAMHVNLLPNNKVIMYDATAFHMSTIKLPNGQCFAYKDEKTGMLNKDCWSHAMEFDIDTAKLRPLRIEWDPWCSSGGLAADGTLISTGGWLQGTRAVRYMRTCENCDWKEYPNALAESRWYATQATLANGKFILVGGRRSYSYEYVPQEGTSNQKSIKFPFLDETSDLDENNLYPFVHLSTDGNVFIFANNRSILLNPETNAIIKEFPVLDGGCRNYPSSGMSALLPIKLENQYDEIIPIVVIVCGGAKPTAYGLAQKGTFLPALEDCNKLEITNPEATWEKETMPSARVMGDMLNLPNGDLLILNGAKKGTAAWYSADDPNLTPVLYSPDEPVNQRFKELEPTTIPRMYHSASIVLPDGRILVGGSNPNAGYNFEAKYPTEMRIEKFSPPYLDPALTEHRPEILVEVLENSLTYRQIFSVQFNVNKLLVARKDIKVTMYAPPFTTHGYSMNQRLLELAKLEVNRLFPGAHKIDVMAPPTSAVAPPGYYLLFVVYKGVPSNGMWVQIK